MANQAQAAALRAQINLGLSYLPADVFLFGSAEKKIGKGVLEGIAIGGLSRKEGWYVASIGAVGTHDWNIPLGSLGKVGLSLFGGKESVNFSGTFDNIGLMNINVGPVGFGGFLTDGELGAYIYRNGPSGHTAGGGGLGYQFVR